MRTEMPSGSLWLVRVVVSFLHFAFFRLGVTGIPFPYLRLF